MNSFSSELGVQFETNLEAPHVIDVDSQVFSPSPLSIVLVTPISSISTIFDP